MSEKELEERALKELSSKVNMTVEEIKKYREYSSRDLTSEEWIEYLQLCEKAFKRTSKYLYLYEHEIKEINKYIKRLQQENQQLKEQLEASEKARREAIEFIKNDMACIFLCDVSGYTVSKLEKEFLNILDIYKGE